MKAGLLIIGACAALGLAGCSTTDNSGGTGTQYETSSGEGGVTVKGNVNPNNITTDPRGGFQSWRYDHSVESAPP
jgi:hypothetical protein